MTNQNLYVIKASAGTGKTYTLAAHYIALLMNGESYRSILAVTFTNKATAEMKERILTYLHAIARETNLPDVQKFLNKVREVSRLRGLREYPDSDYITRAEEQMAAILADYDNMKITTIDSFLQVLLGGMAQAIGQAAGYAVDLELDHAITLATDHILTDEVAEDDQVRNTIISCLNERLSQEEKWDLRPQLINLVKKMYDEKTQKDREQIVFPSEEHPEYAQKLENYRQGLRNTFVSSGAYQAICNAYNQIKPYKDTLAVGTGGKNYSAFYRRVQQLTDMAVTEGDAAKRLGNTDFNRLGKPDKLPLLTAQDLQTLTTQIDIIHNNLDTCLQAYFHYKYRHEHINDLMLVGYVIERIRQNLRENNTILLAETACKLAKALQDEDATFILMKAGIRYKHIMLDEFQDTSTLQWQNFKMLVAELISQMGGSALIVGDVKQSIYRWRNGDYSIMAGLDNDPDIGAQYHGLTLNRNFRSLPNINRFVNHTFAHLATETPVQQQLYKEVFDEYEKDTPANDNDGFVGLWSFKPEKAEEGSQIKQKDLNEQARLQLLSGMYEHMEELLRMGYEPKDMLILVRGTKDAGYVLRYFAQQVVGNKDYPLLSQAGRIESVDSYLLESSTSVNVVISALRWYQSHDEIAKTYLQQNALIAPEELLSQLKVNTPLYDMVEQIITLCLCKDGIYLGHDIAHINCLKDKLRAYIGKFGSDIHDFLQYWDDKMHEEKIPVAESNAIRLMTIHSAKGLEAKNVFLPFCNWEMYSDGTKGEKIWCPVADLHTADGRDALLPISYKAHMADAGFEAEYEAEYASQRIDNLNLLYVALTRPEHNLLIYIYEDSRDNVGKLLRNLYSDNYQLGVMKLHTNPTKVIMSKPFSFKGAAAIDATHHSRHADICFRQSNKTRDMLITHLAGEQPDETNMEFGNLCHAIMEKIRIQDDLDRVLSDFYQQGNIPDLRTRDKIHTLISKLFSQPEAADWFSGKWNIMREETVLIPTDTGIEERRMDRMMWMGDRAVILDYKFGTMKDQYLHQVREYMHIARQMGFCDVKGYLWMAFKNQLIPITE